MIHSEVRSPKNRARRGKLSHSVVSRRSRMICPGGARKSRRADALSGSAIEPPLIAASRPRKIRVGGELGEFDGVAARFDDELGLDPADILRLQDAAGVIAVDADAEPALAWQRSDFRLVDAIGIFAEC